MSLVIKKRNIIKKYSQDILVSSFKFYCGDNISTTRIKNAQKKYAQKIQKSEVVLGLYDTTISGNAKEGYLFTDTKMYWLEMLEKPHKLWYDDIKYIEIIDKGKKDCDNIIKIYLHDGETVLISDCFVNKTPFKHMLQELANIDNNSEEISVDIDHSKMNNIGAETGGIAVGARGQVNKLYDEEKFHAQQGHGFAAERANNLYDRLTGHDAKILGDDCVKNGADRLVDGVYIQSKYCKTGSACVKECFDEEGKFRYIVNGKPMQIEVPSDKYEAAVQAMEDKIRAGKVPGVTDPAEARNIVRKGHFTYEQAKNIAKAGTVESLTYDAVNGAIIATTAFGVTAIITFSVNIWNGEDFDKSLKIATYSGLKVGGTAFVTTILSSQLSKAGLNSALVSSSEAIVAFMGPKASAVLVNAFRNGSNIYGAAAMKSAAKLLRGNVITAGATVVVLSSFDIANIFRGKISGKQLFKNITNTTVTVAGGTGGWLGGAAIGSAILPGVGTVIGGLIGSVAAGAVVGNVSSEILGEFIEDDAEEMVRIIQTEFELLAQEYLLNQKEAEKSCDRLEEKLSGSKLRDMFASHDRKKFARDLLAPIIENEVKKRKYIENISEKEMVDALKVVLEEVADSSELIYEVGDS